MRKNVIRGYKMLDSASMDGTVVSSEVNVINMDKASIFVEWDGSGLSGELIVEAKNSDRGTWFELDFGVEILIDADTGDHLIVFNELPHDVIRITYESVAGSGTIDAVLVAKQVGG